MGQMQRGSDDQSIVDAIESGKLAISSPPEFFEDTNFVSGSSPIVLNINAQLGRNAQSVAIINDGGGDFTFSFSVDGLSFGDQVRIVNGESQIYPVDSHSLRITHVADSSYRVIAI